MRTVYVKLGVPEAWPKSGHREIGLFCCRITAHCMIKCAFAAMYSTLEVLYAGPTMECHVLDGKKEGN